ncbi:Platelet glycoprotein V [Zootermopsis nevadensis]|uniref:Platelet glycoprotein V n=2 Tax=Zootermopsis nevadensis TaxID=136037 RepID=A0A067QQP9_ZOONE|nr:Platelet glycoprotein V [Zootermopsis nevadensis]
MLEEFYVNDNRLNHLDSTSFVSLESMTILNLSGNNLNVLPATLFTYQKKLKELHLDRNNISTLNAELLSPTTQMEVLSISDNKIRKISSAVLEPCVRLKHLDAIRCPIECDCSFKNFYQFCAVRSIKTNITCEGRKYDLSVTLRQMECGIMDKSTIVLIVIIGLFILGKLTEVLLGYITKSRSIFDKRRTTEHVNEYVYVEYPLDAKSKADDVRPRERQRYMSVLHVPLNVYDYLRPIQGQMFNTAERQQRSFEPELPESSAPSRPTSDFYDVAM